MRRIYRILGVLVPEPRNEWVAAHAAEFAEMATRGARARWAIGVLPVFGWALVSQLRNDPKSFVGGRLVLTIVVGVSTVNVVAGLGLGWLVVSNPDVSAIVLVLSIGLIVQGSYALALVFGVFGAIATRAGRLQMAGSALAFSAGTVVFVLGAVRSIDPAGGDPEYGPPTVAFLMALHGLASILAFVRPARRESDRGGSGV